MARAARAILRSRLRPPAHVPLVAAFPAVYLFSENPGSGAVDAAAAAALCAAAAWALWLGLSLLPWGRDGAGLAASAAAALFLMYGHLEIHVYWELERRAGLFTDWEGPAAGALGGGPLASGLASAILSEAFFTASALAAAAALAAAYGPRLGGASRAASAGAAALLALPLAGAAAAGWDGGGGPPGWAPFDLDPGPDPPDVWYILPDSYSGQEGAARLGADAEGLPRALEALGLRHVPGALSNYGSTHDALESLLAMRYAAGVPVVGSASDVGRWLRVMDGNEVVGRFERMGYETHLVRGGVSFKGEHDRSTLGASRVHCEYGGLADSALLHGLARGTAAGGVLEALLDSEKRGKRLCAFGEISRLAAAEGGPPKFVLAHLSLPHYPYIFGPDCGEEGAGTYAAQAACADLLIGRAVAEIMAAPGDPAVIVQADHGARRGAAGLSELESHHGILKAYRFPGGAPSPAFEGSTPVNTFRVLFDEHFGGRYGLLEDRVVLSCGVPRPPEPGGPGAPALAEECRGKAGGGAP